MVSPQRKERELNIIWWLIVGLLAGAIAGLLVPGRDPMGVLGTLLLGLVGSLIGGFLGTLFESGKPSFSPAGRLGSIGGASIALRIYRAAVGRRYFGRRSV